MPARSTATILLLSGRIRTALTIAQTARSAFSRNDFPSLRDYSPLPVVRGPPVSLRPPMLPAAEGLLLTTRGCGIPCAPEASVVTRLRNCAREFNMHRDPLLTDSAGFAPINAGQPLQGIRDKRLHGWSAPVRMKFRHARLHPQRNREGQCLACFVAGSTGPARLFGFWRLPLAGWRDRKMRFPRAFTSA